MLGTLEEHQKLDWKSYVPPLVQAYNATRNEATGFSPHYLMFGWNPRLSVDAYLGVDPEDDGTSERGSYVRKLQERLQYAYKVAAREVEKNAAQNKERYDRNVKETKIEVGDRVLVRNVGLKGKHKLADRWQQEPYLVIRKPNSDIPVYEVQRDSGKGPTRILHRNLLLPFNSMPPITENTETGNGNHRNFSRMQTRSRNRFAKLHSSSESDSSDSDSTHSYNGNRYVIPQRRRRSEQISPFSTPHRPAVQPFVDRPQTVFHSPLDDSDTSVVRDRAESSITASPEYEIDRSDVIGITVPPQPQFALSSDESNGTTVTPTHHVRRPARERKPPDRYGQWLYSQTIVEPEIFV